VIPAGSGGLELSVDQAQSLDAYLRDNQLIPAQPIIKRSFYLIYTMLNNAFTDRMDKVGNLLS
jgi:hypothetical protein